MVITVVKKGQIRMVITVVKKGQIRVVITVVKKGQLKVVITVLKRGKSSNVGWLRVIYLAFMFQKTSLSCWVSM